MRSSVIKIKRRDLMKAEEVATLLRSLADQLDEAHTITLDRLPITLANQVLVRQEYKKDGTVHELSLKISWQEKYMDAVKLSEDEPESEEREGDGVSEHDVPTTPLDLPGPAEESIRLRE